MCLSCYEGTAWEKNVLCDSAKAINYHAAHYKLNYNNAIKHILELCSEELEKNMFSSCYCIPFPSCLE